MRHLALALAASVAACGDNLVAGELPDGPVAAAPVTLTVLLADGTPNMGVRVYFQDADSTLVSATTTDATGTASAVMAEGGYVTAIDPNVSPPSRSDWDDVETFGGVKPGDHLRFNLGPSSSAISVNVTAPLDPDPRVANYVLLSSCGNNLLKVPTGSGAVHATGSIELVGCGGTADILIVTYDPYGAVPIGYIYAPSTPIADHGNLDFTASTYVAATTRSITLDDTLPRALIDVTDVLATARGEVFTEIRRWNAGYPRIALALPEPAFPGAFDIVITKQWFGVSSSRNIIDSGPYASTYLLDYAAHLVPDIPDLPTFDTTTHRMTWSETAGALPPDFLSAEVTANRGAQFHPWSWRIVAPYGSALAFPTLPTDGFDFNIAASDTFELESLRSFNVSGGYDAVRERFLALGRITDLAYLTQGLVTYAEVINPEYVPDDVPAPEPRLDQPSPMRAH